MEKEKEQKVIETNYQQKAILALTEKKHVKIYLLHTTGLKGGHIAKLLSTNAGHCGNVIREYSLVQTKVDYAMSKMPLATAAE